MQFQPIRKNAQRKPVPVKKIEGAEGGAMMSKMALEILGLGFLGNLLEAQEMSAAGKGVQQNGVNNTATNINPKKALNPKTSFMPS